VAIVVHVVVILVTFLLAIRLLGSTTDALSPVLRQYLDRFVVGDWSALGISWVASYALANGSVVAALSLSLFDAELIVTSQLFLMIVGSRLGGAAVVVFIGAFDYLNEELDTLSESVRLGVLTFLLTHSIYLPVLVVGYVSVSRLQAVGIDPLDGLTTTSRVPDVSSVVASRVIDVLGPALGFVLAIGLVFLSMRLFDRLLGRLDKQRLRRRYLTRLNDKWVSFGTGLVVTGLTTSVAFSLGVIVPLYNRGHIKRDEIIPYVIGANIGTLVDTLIVAVALDTAVGVLTVAMLLGISLVVSLVALVFYPVYAGFIGTMQDELLESTVLFVGFLLSLLVVPLLLVALL
jgi:sodium-dependent phosphate cotransporter